VFLTRAWFPRTSLHNTWSVSPNGPPGRMFKETCPRSDLMICDKYRGKKYRPQCVNKENFNQTAGLTEIKISLYILCSKYIHRQTCGRILTFRQILKTFYFFPCFLFLSLFIKLISISSCPVR
jgi:hypothetical protein